MDTAWFSYGERVIFRCGKEIKGLRGGVHRYAAQASLRIDAATAEKGRSRMKIRKGGEMARILVAGGAGFIGSHLVRRLLVQGHEVVCVDNLSTGFLSNLEDVLGFPQFHFVEADISEPLDVAFDAAFNLACPASPPHYQRLALETIEACTLGVRNLLSAALRQGAQLVHASTSEVYGDPEVHPQPEQYHGNVGTLTERACYDEGKRLAETLCYEYHKRGCSVRIARLFNTYGPFMHRDDGRVVSNFIVSALSGRPLTVYGDGSQTRSFCFVSDTVEALLRLLALPAVHLPVFNLGNPREMKVVDLARLVLHLTGSDAPIHFLPPAAADPGRRRPCIERARRALDWQPRVSLETGLQETIGYFREVLQVAGDGFEAASFVACP
jgi:UDP-glucuronate decarboxylase